MTGKAEGAVSLVGAGPGDPELLTLAGRDRLARADVVIVDDLINPALLIHCPPHAELLQQRVHGPLARDGAEQLDQARINELMVAHAKAGRYVVRLEGEDPMMSGRGAEEAQYLGRHGVNFELVPGVSSPIAALQAAGIPITHRDHTPSVSFVLGYEAYQKAGLTGAWEHLALSAGTLVLMMSVKNVRLNAQRLVDAGRSPTTPAAMVRWGPRGTRGSPQTVLGTLGDIADRAEAAAIPAPAVMVVGDVLALREHIQWFERRPLFGRRVVVTRAARQAGGLVNLLAAAGADVVVFPCLDFVPATPEQQRALDQALRSFQDPHHIGPAATHEFAGVIVSSPNGVEALFEALARVELDVRIFAGKLVAAIGTGTAERLIQRGLRPDIVPARARAEGLLEALREHGVLGRQWLQIRADEGRELLARAIAEAGGELELVPGYQTVRPAVPAPLLASLRPASEGGEGYDAVCFASGRTARHFLETTSETFGEHQARAQLAGAKVIAIGPVTAKAITALGLHVDVVAEQPSEEGLRDAVLAAFA